MTHTRLTVAAALAVLAGAVTLAPVFQTGSYFWHCTGAVLAVAGTAHLARRARLPAALVPLASLAALLGYLTLMYARDVAVLWVVPGPGAFSALRALYDSGVEDVLRFAAPVRPYEGIVAITAAGVGLVAVVVDLVAVTLRRAAVAGLPLLVLYSVPAAVVPDGVGWVPFAVGAAGFLGLLLADGTERVRRWGRPLGREAGERASARAYVGEVETTALSRVGRRVGAAALGVAVVVPALLPSLDEGVFGPGGPGFGSGSGSRSVAVVNPIVDLRRDLVLPENRLVLRYRTNDPDPGYLRMVTLDEFTGESWVPAELEAADEQEVSRGIPPPAGLADVVPTTRYRTEIEVGDLRDPRLPLPYPAVEVSADGDWRYDEATRNVFSFRNDTRGLRYDVEHLDVRASAGALRAASGGAAPASASYTQVPDEVPPLLSRLAEQVTADALTDYDAALAIQQWLRDFEYSLDVRSGNNGEALVDFLQDRSGYCEQFAATMALMARVEGIPARVNVGFTQGRPVDGDLWEVRLHDAHAWPELYFPGVGWVPFEPTPRSDGSTPTPPYAGPEDVQAPEETGGTTGGGDTGGSSTNPRSANEGRTQQELDLARRRLESQFGAQDSGTAGTSSEEGGAPTLLLVVAGLVVVAAASPATARLAVRRLRGRRLRPTPDGALAGWREVEDTAWDHGVPRQPHETAQAFGERLATTRSLSPEAAAAVRRLARVVARVRFAPSAGDVPDVRPDVTAVRAGLASGASRGARWRARLLPPSTRALATWVAERVADGLDWLDETGSRIRTETARRLGRRRSAG